MALVRRCWRAHRMSTLFRYPKPRMASRADCCQKYGNGQSCLQLFARQKTHDLCLSTKIKRQELHASLVSHQHENSTGAFRGQSGQLSQADPSNSCNCELTNN
eukprot:6172886-Pleurochrysis_carterae.AAC.2